MAEPIRVTADVLVPAAALSLRMSRSSGPGGQNVNKVASKVELRVDLSRIEGLPPEALQRLEGLAHGRRDGQGLLVVTSQRTRDQNRNLEDARDKVRRMVTRALVVPRERRPTRATPASREQRLERKRRAAARKRGRARVSLDEE